MVMNDKNGIHGWRHVRVCQEWVNRSITAIIFDVWDPPFLYYYGMIYMRLR